MHIGKDARMFRAALYRSGERVAVILGDKRYTTRAVVENTGKNFMRKYPEPEPIGRAGRKHDRNKLAFLCYDKRFDDYVGNIYVIWRGRRYLVLSDAVMRFGDEPIYIWAMLTEVSKAKEGYYDDTK